jgi:peptidyl-prolyl cis-trans isomerase SurA
MAITRSAGSRALEGGDLGWRKAGELPSLFSDVVIGLEPGETPPPMRSGRGFHIIQLLERRGVSSLMVEQGRVRHILVKPSEIRTPAETRELIYEIYDRIVADEAFEDLARQYSEDTGTALSGGDLGWSESASFRPEFAAAMDSAEIGVLVEPFQTSFGWHVLEVEERRDQDMSEEAMRNMALRILHNRRFDEELESWLGEIRDEAYVEIRLDSAQSDTPSEDAVADEG